MVEAIKPLAASTQRPGVAGGLGGFGALFDLKAAGYRDPLLVAGTDGVGTKLKLAIATGLHGGIGVDLVAMCANDLVVQGAEPLFFLDYYATGALDPAVGREIVAGIAEGCRQAGCALIGDETAEMPGMYAEGDYDLAGFCVGAVERDQLLDGSRVREGDLLLGLAASPQRRQPALQELPSLAVTPRSECEPAQRQQRERLPRFRLEDCGCQRLQPLQIFGRRCLGHAH